MADVTLAEFSEFLSGQGFDNEIDGDGAVRVSAVNTLEDAQAGEISFLSNPKYTDLLGQTKASAVISDRSVAAPEGLTLLRCDDPYAGVTAAIIRIHGYRVHPEWGIDDRAIIAESATVGDGANIGPYVTISDHVVIGEDVTIYPGCYLGEHAVVGDRVILFPNVVIYDHACLGNRITVHAGSVIGQDGLGYVRHKGGWLKIPQVGKIVIEDDVEIGAACALDRATLGTTRIGRGTKMSDSVVVGHGASIGEECMFVAQVGIAGSATIGNHVTLAGQSGVGGHLTVGDGATVGARGGVITDLEPGREYGGFPAVEVAAFRRQVVNLRRLPELRQRVRDLEQIVRGLRGQVGRGDDQID